ncbi:MAG TPA: 4-(cytidine 5'-diphospho)-2-C-methyl-D-erythritol kinase [Bacteroidales bacterium]|nr:4-(cytidine 5'-diphospho)-2-C-methyl-D-erythritol kinase [Bacteroidales bacterium]
MVIFPKAKINLGLRITARRPDGFHDIETIFYPVGLCDILEMTVNDDKKGKDIFSLSGLGLDADQDGNLVIKAVRKLREAYDLPPLKIHLHKIIPPGTGLGGGSSDAAGALRTMNRVFELALSAQELKTIALDLGSDCPFFIDCQPAFATGRGENLRQVDAVLEGLYIVLVNPGIPISTREAYLKCSPSKTGVNLSELIHYPVAEWKSHIINDFEKTVFEQYPQIGIIKRVLYNNGALYSSMSGSGSAVYGIYADKPEIPEILRDYVIYKGIL